MTKHLIELQIEKWEKYLDYEFEPPNSLRVEGMLHMLELVKKMLNGATVDPPVIDNDTNTNS